MMTQMMTQWNDDDDDDADDCVDGDHDDDHDDDDDHLERRNGKALPQLLLCKAPPVGWLAPPGYNRDQDHHHYNHEEKDDADYNRTVNDNHAITVIHY